MKKRNGVVRFLLVVCVLAVALASVGSAMATQEVLGKIVLRGGANVRQEPNDKAEIVGKVSTGQEFEVLEIDWDTGWYGIQLEDGQFGYVAQKMARFTEVSDKETAAMFIQADKNDPIRGDIPFLGTLETRGSGYVREKGGETYSVIGRFAKGQQLDTIEVDEASGWYGVMRKDGTIGYISPKMVKFTPVPTASVAAEDQAAQTILGTITLRGSANFRSGPNQAYDEVGSGREGKEYNVVEIVSDAGWYGVVWEDGTTAYVSSKMARFSPATDMDILPGIVQAARDSEYMTDRPILGQITTKGAANVRDSGSELGLAIGQTTVGQKFDVVEIDEKSGWYGFVREDGKMGYISPKMCTYVEAN